MKRRRKRRRGAGAVALATFRELIKQPGVMEAAAAEVGRFLERVGPITVEIEQVDESAELEGQE